MEGRELQHFFHKHPLILRVEEPKTNGSNDHPGEKIKCDGCLITISGPFYSCEECRFFLHKVCAELPRSLDHPLHPKHTLVLFKSYPFSNVSFHCDLCGKEGPGKGPTGFIYYCNKCSFHFDMTCASGTQKIVDKCHPHPLTPLQVPLTFFCHICCKEEEGLSYKCYSCPFWVHQNCTLLGDTVEHSHHDYPYALRELQHFFHEHPLMLIAYECKTEYGIEHTNMKLECYGCRTPILGPFYSCGECQYFLHKVCAELPSVLDHPLHPEHPLSLLQRSHNDYKCFLCRETGSKMMVFYCSICEFYVDIKCALVAHVIQEKCHPHPLTPLEIQISFLCHVCLEEKKGLSYRCNICPFRVHQNCTLIPSTVKQQYHGHLLKLIPSIPFKYSKVSEYCDICHGKLFMYQCIYGCEMCLFFAHASCAISEAIQPTSTSWEQNTDGQSLILLPMKQNSTDLISRFVRNYIDVDVNIVNKIDYFDHEHPLFLIDEKTNDKSCDACAIPISPPSYGCVECNYFLHKCCTDLPKQIRHPLHPQHQLTLHTASLLWCEYCKQCCNLIFYRCSECVDFGMDINCASILQTSVVYHEAHKHPLIPIIKSSSSRCTACGDKPYFEYILHCDTCKFELCFRCAMMPPVMEHRYGKSEPFILTYSPLENHYSEYICELCMKDLNPKLWFYHCVFADQFVHVKCMVDCGANSNIKYGKSIKFKGFHEHEVTTISCIYDVSCCSRCRHPLRTGLYAGVGLECNTCNFRTHLYCP